MYKIHESLKIAKIGLVRHLWTQHAMDASKTLNIQSGVILIKRKHVLSRVLEFSSRRKIDNGKKQNCKIRAQFLVFRP